MFAHDYIRGVRSYNSVVLRHRQAVNAIDFHLIHSLKKYHFGVRPI